MQPPPPPPPPGDFETPLAGLLTVHAPAQLFGRIVPVFIRCHAVQRTNDCSTLSAIITHLEVSMTMMPSRGQLIAKCALPKVILPLAATGSVQWLAETNKPLPMQMIMAEAAAAGIHRSGMRRHAFSTGDLQALQPNPDEAPLSFGPPPSSVFRMGSMALRAPRLESVPEGSVTQLTSSRPAVDRYAFIIWMRSRPLPTFDAELKLLLKAASCRPVQRDVGAARGA